MLWVLMRQVCKAAAYETLEAQAILIGLTLPPHPPLPNKWHVIALCYVPVQDSCREIWSPTFTT